MVIGAWSLGVIARLLLVVLSQVVGVGWAGLRSLLVGVAGMVVAGLWLGEVEFSLPLFYFVVFSSTTIALSTIFRKMLKV